MPISIWRGFGALFARSDSGPATKEAFDPWAFWFLSQGFAVITADKRGCGRSSGDWRTTSLTDLADDARAILAMARSQGAPSPIFGWGASQAGWILPQLGASGAIDGLLMHAGAVTTPARQILGQVEAELRAYQFPQTDIDAAIAYYALDIDVSRGVRPHAEIEAAYRRASAQGVEWILSPPPAADAPERTMIMLMADFDPTPYWQGNMAPVLALFGGRDWIVPADENLSLLRRVVPPGCELTASILPDANHLMFVAESGVRSEYASRSLIVDGYYDAMAGWLRQRA